MNLKDVLPEKKKVWNVGSEVSASIFQGILAEEGVPFEFFTQDDGILGAIQYQEKGYGCFLVPQEWEVRMEELFRDFSASEREAHEL